MSQMNGKASGYTVAGGLVQRSALFGRLASAARVTQVSGLAGSGKTVLLRSWLSASGAAQRAAWIDVPRGGCAPKHLWRLMIDSLRATPVGAPSVRAWTAEPDGNGWEILEGLLEDLRGAEQTLWLVIDDLHELRSEEGLRQLEMFLVRAPSSLRIMLCSRQDMPLGLHRLRLTGDLTEIRNGDLLFTLEESRALFAASGVRPSEASIALLQQRTEGWAAGLRLAACALATHPDPERFAAEFCGSERMVAEYLLAEVLGDQTEPVKRLLQCTSLLERVNGALADHLTGGSGGEGILRDLERANAFVFALDAERSWFRYHPLLADLLRSELRRSAPAELTRVRTAAAEWYAAHEDPQLGQIIEFPGGSHRPQFGPGGSLLEPLSESEIRVLRYLPTNLSRGEIASELYVSVNTVKTHMSRLFAKLGAHSRSQAVERARRLGLLGMSRPQRLTPQPPRLNVNLPVAPARPSLSFARSQHGRDAEVLRHSAGMKLHR